MSHDGSPARGFQTTRWSLVTAAGRDDEVGRRALAELCELYWPPVHAFLWRKTGDPELAADLTQGLFADLLARDDLGKADPERGRFRSFLLKCAQNFAAKERARARAARRGGGRPPLSLDALRAEAGGAELIAASSSPEAAFHRRWATALLDEVTRRLRVEHELRGRGAVFDALRNHLAGEAAGETYADASRRLLAAGLDVREPALRVTVHRMRQRFRELLLEQVAETTGPDSDPGEELRDLLAALRGGAAEISASQL